LVLLLLDGRTRLTLLAPGVWRRLHDAPATSASRCAFSTPHSHANPSRHPLAQGRSVDRALPARRSTHSLALRFPSRDHMAANAAQAPAAATALPTVRTHVLLARRALCVCVCKSWMRCGRERDGVLSASFGLAARCALAAALQVALLSGVAGSRSDWSG
jgi:hypothetical protein